MGLFIMSSNLVEQCSTDFNDILCENFEGPVAGSIDEDLDSIAKRFNAAKDNIMKGGQPTGEASIINDISKVKNLNLEKYEQKVKSDKTGTFSKIWTRLKAFIVKVIHAIVKAINKAHGWIKKKVGK